MDQLLEQRKELIKTFLEERQGFPNEDHLHLRDILSIDQNEHHFILSTIGWDQMEFICEIVIHLELREDGAIWIYENKTDLMISDFFIENGIIESEIFYAKNQPVEQSIETIS